MKRKLFLLLALMLTSISTWAQKANLTTDKGWTQITELPGTLRDYFFALYTHDDDFAMKYGEGNDGQQSTGKYTMKYAANVDANETTAAVWKFENWESNITFRSIDNDSRTLQTEWDAAWYMHTNDQPDPCQWSQVAATYSLDDAAWYFTNGKYPGDNSFIGPWSSVAEGNDIAANKASSAKTLFDVFSITRGRWVQNVASEATESAPVEITKVLDNPDAERRVNGQGNQNGLGGWTITGSGISVQKNSAYGEGQTWYFQNWVSSGTIPDANMSQTINNLPNGKYRITVNGAFGGNGCSVFANTAETAFGSDVADYSAVAVVTNGTLTVGVKSVSATSTYLRYDNFRLYYLGEDLTAYVEAYEAALEAAKAFDQSQKMAAFVKTALNTTIDTYDEGKVDETDKDALIAATTALNTATSNANTSVASYAVIAAGTVPDDKLDGWVCENSNTFHINTWSSEGNSDGSNMVTPFIENWVGKGSYLGAGRVYYQLQGLNPGEVYYAQALVRSYNEASSDAPNGPNFFINDEIVNMSDVGTTFTYNNMSGIYATLGGAATVGEDGTLTLGVSIAENRNYNWVAFKSISIQPMDNAFNAAVAEVTGLEGTIPTAAYNKAYAVVQKWLDDYPTTVAGFESAIAEIGAAADEAKTCVAPYAEYNKKHAAVLALYNVDEYDELVSGAHDALGTALSTAATNVNNAEDADDINNVTDALKEAGATYAGNANPTNENKPFNLTFMLTNPDLTGLPTWAPAAGWYTEQTGGNSQVMTNEGAAGPHGDAFYEYWSEVAAANDKFTLYQKVTLPAGTYTMKCDAFSSQATGGDNCAVYFYANDTQGDLVHNYPMQAKTLSFVNSSEQEVKIGLKALSGNTYRWMGIGYVELYKVPAQVFVISENADYDNTQSGAGDVTLTRTIKVGLNTLVLPFSMTQTEVEANFGADSKVYVVNSYDSNNDNIKFDEHDGISANMPCLLKATVAGTAYNIEGRTIVAGEPTVAGTNVSMTGSYAASITIPYNNYVISGGSIYLVDSDVTMKGTRAYISITGGNNARELILNLDGEVTAINAIEEADAEAEGLKDGKYLIGGKIVIVNNGVKYSANGQILK